VAGRGRTVDSDGAATCSPAERDRLAVARLLTFFRPRTGRWKTPTGEAWQPALALDAVINTYERTRDPGYLRVVERSFARYRGRRSRFYDDDGWYLNAWLRAYDVTGDDGYLSEAEALFTGMTRAWDGACGGGLWWSTDRAYKNAITNELFLLAAARLHRRAPHATGQLSYGDWAARAWAWFDASGMVNDQHQVNDGLDASCANNGGVTWTYNQGVILGALVELWRITGDPGHLRRAEQIADATIATHVSGEGILKEPCEPDNCTGNGQVFKGVFAQGLARLYGAVCADKPGYGAFLKANADSLWHAGRDRRNGFGLSWTGPAGRVTAATQTAASLLIGEVALLERGGNDDTVRPLGVPW
jgi:predicted alpha-1,6-mannanase (GH76 family)